MGYIPCPVHYTSLYLIYFILSNLYILTPYSYFAPPSKALFMGNHKFVLCIC